jgi:TonB family protein
MATLGLRDAPPQHTLALPSLPELKLFFELPSRRSVFFGNLLDLFRRTPPPRLSSRPAPFWPDVFVPSAFPVRAFMRSALYHIFALVVIWGATETWLHRAPAVVLNDPLEHATITYYSVSEYLPPLQDLSERPRQELKGEPEEAPQPIISVPRAPDNSRQTIVTPPELRIHRDLRLPNVIAWKELPVGPPPETGRPRLRAPDLPAPVPIDPPPLVDNARLRMPALPRPAPVEPPPSVENSRLARGALPVPSAVEPPISLDAAKSRLGDLTVAQLTPQAAAPKLPVPAQRASGVTTSGGQTSEPVPAPPAIPVQPAGAVGQLIALSARPVLPAGPIDVPIGRRSGTFAATPEGKPGAPATPNIPGGGTAATGTGSDKAPPGSTAGPGGISVGAAPVPVPSGPIAVQGKPYADPRQVLMAHASRPSVADLARHTRPSPSAPDAPKLVEEVFGPKKYYSMVLNMPNLTSAGGSWVMRFAELEEQAGGELRGPVATVKVDPAYPPDLRHAGVEGTVVLYALIRADGMVSQIRVLRGVDQRLDENARVALSRWQFKPAMKNGSAVDLEAIVQIPFVAQRRPF